MRSTRFKTGAGQRLHSCFLKSDVAVLGPAMIRTRNGVGIFPFRFFQYQQAAKNLHATQMLQRTF
jgi:hypothetical protein